ncbi:hypothetical protein [Flavobacterium alkalisoli]|uniref:hypothetical protein n=1 Tax=Flavobacterium alkalisoli TaxID=2602769 RepID=UPI003A8D1783
MKLVLLIPTVVLMAISGYNLSVEFTKTGEANYLIFKAVHLTVLLISILCTAAIIRSMFKIKYVEIPETNNNKNYNELEIQHS